MKKTNVQLELEKEIRSFNRRLWRQQRDAELKEKEKVFMPARREMREWRRKYSGLIKNK